MVCASLVLHGVAFAALKTDLRAHALPRAVADHTVPVTWLNIAPAATASVPEHLVHAVAHSTPTPNRHVRPSAAIAPASVALPSPAASSASRVIADAPELSTRGPAVLDVVQAMRTTMPADRGVDVAAAYQHNPAPAYPALSRRMGEAGEVRLRVRVGAAGTVEDVAIERSSGFVRLDRAAELAVARWRFTPAVHDGQPVMAWAVIPIVFSLRSV